MVSELQQKQKGNFTTLGFLYVQSENQIESLHSKNNFGSRFKETFVNQNNSNTAP